MEISAPVMVHGEQAWRARGYGDAGSAIIKFTGSVGSSNFSSIAADGEGEVHLCGANTFTGEFTAKEGIVRAYSETAFGTKDGKTVLVSPHAKETARESYPRIIIHANRICENFEFHANDVGGRVRFEGDGSGENLTVTVDGSIESKSANILMDSGKNVKRLVFAGPVTSASLFLPSVNNAAGTEIVYEEKFTGSVYQGLWNTACIYMKPLNGGPGKSISLGGTGEFRVEADNPIHTGTTLGMNGMWYMNHGGVLNLNGHDATVARLSAPKADYLVHAGVVKSAEPAKLTVGGWTGTATEDNVYVDFEGLVTLVCAHDAARTMKMIAPSTSAGDVEVRSGTLEFADDGSWLCGTNFTVTGGTLSLAKSGALNEKFAKISIASPGKLRLAEGTETVVRGLTLDGVRLRSGTYGKGSIEIEAIEGDGILKALPEVIGTIITIR